MTEVPKFVSSEVPRLADQNARDNFAAIDAAQKREATSLDLLGHAFKETSTFTPYFSSYAARNFEHDPLWAPSADTIIKMSEGLPASVRDDIREARSLAHAEAIRDHSAKTQTASRIFTEKYGAASLMGSYIVAGFLQPEALLATAAGGGIYKHASNAAKFSRLQRFAQTGAVAATEGMLFAGAREAGDPLMSEGDILTVGAFAGILGGSMGAIASSNVGKKSIGTDAAHNGESLQELGYKEVSSHEKWWKSPDDDGDIFYEYVPDHLRASHPTQLGPVRPDGDTFMPNAVYGAISFVGDRFKNFRSIKVDLGGQRGYVVHHDGRVVARDGVLTITGAVDDAGKIRLDGDSVTIATGKDMPADFDPSLFHPQRNEDFLNESWSKAQKDIGDDVDALFNGRSDHLLNKYPKPSSREIEAQDIRQHRDPEGAEVDSNGIVTYPEHMGDSVRAIVRRVRTVHGTAYLQQWLPARLQGLTEALEDVSVGNLRKSVTSRRAQRRLSDIYEGMDADEIVRAKKDAVNFEAEELFKEFLRDVYYRRSHGKEFVESLDFDDIKWLATHSPDALDKLSISALSRLTSRQRKRVRKLATQARDRVLEGFRERRASAEAGDLIHDPKTNRIGVVVERADDQLQVDYGDTALQQIPEGKAPFFSPERQAKITQLEEQLETASKALERQKAGKKVNPKIREELRIRDDETLETLTERIKRDLEQEKRFPESPESELVSLGEVDVLVAPKLKIGGFKVTKMARPTNAKIIKLREKIAKARGRLRQAEEATERTSLDAETELDVWDRSGVQQAVGSAKTSRNQIPRVFKLVANRFEEGTTNVDIGGGAWEMSTEFLETRGVRNLVYDPYNRTVAHNASVINEVSGGRADTVTVANVLNVIKEKAARKRVLLQAENAIKPDGEVYISVHDAKRSGGPQATRDGWQNSWPLKKYTDEIAEVFDIVEQTSEYIIAKKRPVDTAETDLKAIESNPWENLPDVAPSRYKDWNELTNDLGVFDGDEWKSPANAKYKELMEYYWKAGVLTDDDVLLVDLALRGSKRLDNNLLDDLELRVSERIERASADQRDVVVAGRAGLTDVGKERWYMDIQGTVREKGDSTSPLFKRAETFLEMSKEVSDNSKHQSLSILLHELGHILDFAGKTTRPIQILSAELRDVLGPKGFSDFIAQAFGLKPGSVLHKHILSSGSEFTAQAISTFVLKRGQAKLGTRQAVLEGKLTDAVSNAMLKNINLLDDEALKNMDKLTDGALRTLDALSALALGFRPKVVNVQGELIKVLRKEGVSSTRTQELIARAGDTIAAEDLSRILSQEMTDRGITRASELLKDIEWEENGVLELLEGGYQPAALIDLSGSKFKGNMWERMEASVPKIDPDTGKSSFSAVVRPDPGADIPKLRKELAEAEEQLKKLEQKVQQPAEYAGEIHGVPIKIRVSMADGSALSRKGSKVFELDLFGSSRTSIKLKAKSKKAAIEEAELIVQRNKRQAQIDDVRAWENQRKNRTEDDIANEDLAISGAGKALNSRIDVAQAALARLMDAPGIRSLPMWRALKDAVDELGITPKAPKRQLKDAQGKVIGKKTSKAAEPLIDDDVVVIDAQGEVISGRLPEDFEVPSKKIFNVGARDVFFIYNKRTGEVTAPNNLLDEIEDLAVKKDALSRRKRNADNGEADPGAFDDTPNGSNLDDIQPEEAFGDVGVSPRVFGRIIGTGNRLHNSLRTRAQSSSEAMMRWLGFETYGNQAGQEAIDGSIKPVIDSADGLNRVGIEQQRQMLRMGEFAEARHKSLDIYHEWRSVTKMGFWKHLVGVAQDDFGQRITKHLSNRELMAVPIEQLSEADQLVRKAALLHQQGYKKALRWLKKHDPERWKDVPESDFYVPRMFDANRYQMLLRQYGEGNLINLVAKSFIVGNPRLNQATAKKVAKLYLSKVGGSKFSMGMFNDPRIAKDPKKFADTLMKEFGIDSDTADDIASFFWEAEKGTGHSQRRMKMGDNVSLRMDGVEGERVVHIRELFEQNIFKLTDRYNWSVISSTMVTEMIERFNNKLGRPGLFTNLDDIRTYIIQDARSKGVATDHLEQQLDMLIRTARGHGHTDSVAFNDAMSMGRDGVYAFGYGSTFGRAALTEVIPTAFGRGIGIFLESSPTFRGWTNAEFQIPKAQIKFMLEAQGMGMSTRRFMKMDFLAQNLDEGLPQGATTQNVRRGLRGAANATSELSGLNAITQWTEELSMRVNTYANVKMMLAGEAPNEARLAQMGLTKADWDTISGQLNKHMKKTPGENGTDTVDLNFGEWDDQVSVAKFMNAMYTEVLGNVTRGDRADLPEWFHKSGLHSSIGNVLLQFRRFGLSSHRNVLTRNVKANDGRAVMAALTSTLGGLMTYVLSNMFVFDDTKEGREKYKERMSLERLVYGAISRSPITGSLLDVANPAMGLVTGSDLSGNHRYGLGDNVIDQIPLVSMTDSIAKTGRAMFQVGTGQRDFEDHDRRSIERTFGYLKHPFVQPLLSAFD